MSRPAADPTPMPEPLLSVDDVALWLGVSDKFVRRHQRELGGRKVGGLLKFDRADVQAYLDRGRVAGAVVAPTPLDDERQKRRPVLKHATRENPLDGRPW